MTNKLTRKKPNRLLTGRNNYYSLGSTLKSAFGKKGGAWGAVGSAVGGLAGSSISGGMLTGVGNALQSLSGIASAIPGPWGAAIGAGLQVVGGLTNRMFGSKMNTENIAKVESNINSLNSFQSNASDFDTLASNWANADTGMTFRDSFIGKDGWFSNKAKNKAADLRKLVEAGNAWVLNSLTNNAENIGNTQMQNLLANYAAFGGPLLYAQGGGIHIKPSKRGTFTAAATKHGMSVQEFASRVLANKDNYSPAMVKKANFAKNASKWHSLGGNLFEDGGKPKRVNFSRYTPFMDRGFSVEGMEQLQDSLINRGFTLPLRTAIMSAVLHESGGDPKAKSKTGKYRGLLQWGPDRYPGTDDMGELINYLIESSLDSSSPNWTHGGSGAPTINSAEEGYNTFWDSSIGPYNAGMFYNKGYVRPESKLARVNRAVESRRMWEEVRKKAFGGDLLTHGANFDTGITLVGNGNTHEQNPYEGVLMGVDPEGTPNLVEEGEVIFNDYVFSNRLKVPEEMRKKYKLKGSKLSFAEAATQMSKESEERPNDPISKAGLEDSMMKLMIAQEQLRTKRNKTNTFSKGGKMGRIYAGELDDPYSQILNLGRGPLNPGIMWTLEPPKKEPSTPIKKPVKNEMGIVLGGYTSNPTIIKPGESTIPEIIGLQRTKYPSPPVPDQEDAVDDVDTNNSLVMSPTWMRYIPAFASGVMSITDALGLTNKPDYGEAKAVLEAARSVGTYNPIRFRPVGNYLTYRPFDRDFYTNKLNAESSAARRAVLNTSGGNRAQALAGILAADYNAQGKMGDLFRQAEEYNLTQRQKVEEFNRATDMFNSEGIFKADQANQSAQLQARSSYLRGALTAAELRQKERQATTAARSANLSNFINSLGDIGRENFSRNMIVSDPSKYYTINNSNGEVSYKNSFYDLSLAEQDYITGYASRKSKSKSKRSLGGYLTIKRK